MVGEYSIRRKHEVYTSYNYTQTVIYYTRTFLGSSNYNVHYYELLRHGWYLDTNLSKGLLLQLWQLLGTERDEPKTRPTILVVIDQLEGGSLNHY